ncbi:MAG: hemolysin III family protein [Anaerolineae bacterium]|jgi:hemolysin III|nr:hemolysin III family protein [Anaerolineae bacterium]
MERPQSRGEEIANALSHGIAFIAALVALPILISSTQGRETSNVVGVVIFSTTMVMLYLASTLYHALPAGGAKRVFKKLDHGAIYVFVAGSYTPFALGPLSGPWGWSLFGSVWGLAVVGVTLKAVDRLTMPWMSTGLYLFMGWLAVIASAPLLDRVPLTGVILIVAGGLAYTAGVVFFMLDERLRYAHTVWHGFVIAGSACHFFAVLGYAA